jgi:hypothetical protein
MENGEIYECSRCDAFKSLILRTLLNHYHTVHCNEPNFNVICGVGGCPATFTKYNSFYKHVTRKHRDAYSETNLSNPYEAQCKRVREDDHSDESEDSETESESIPPVRDEDRPMCSSDSEDSLDQSSSQVMDLVQRDFRRR